MGVSDGTVDGASVGGTDGSVEGCSDGVADDTEVSLVPTMLRVPSLYMDNGKIVIALS